MAAPAVERFDPEGGKSPEGERRPGEQSIEPQEVAVTGTPRRSGRGPGQTGERLWSDGPNGQQVQAGGLEVAGWER